MTLTASLLAGSRLEFNHQVGGHLAAVFHLDALCPGPLADLGRVQPACRSAAAAGGWLAGAAADTAGSIHVPGQHIPQFPGVPDVLRDACHEHLAPPIVSTVMAVCFRARATAP